MEAGRLDAAQESLDTAFAAVPAGSDFFADLARTLARCRAQLALLRGRAAEGDAQLQALLPQLGWGTAKPAGGLVAALPLAARAALAVGDAARARTLAEAALKIAQERARGPELSAWVGRAWVQLAEVQQRQGQLQEAALSRQQALPILLTALGPQHPDLLRLQALLAR